MKKEKLIDLTNRIAEYYDYIRPEEGNSTILVPETVDAQLRSIVQIAAIIQQPVDLELLLQHAINAAPQFKDTTELTVEKLENLRAEFQSLTKLLDFSRVAPDGLPINLQAAKGGQGADTSTQADQQQEASTEAADQSAKKTRGRRRKNTQS